MYRVILIDDEIWALKGLKNIIDWTTYGFEIIAVYTDPYEAVESFAELHPDVVFTDIRMEGISGLDLIKKARNANMECEFVFVSAYSDFNAAREALELDVFHYLLKPLDKSKVIKLIKRLSDHLSKKNINPETKYIDFEESNGKDWPKLNIPVTQSAYCYAVIYDSFDWDLDIKKKYKLINAIVINKSIRMFLISSKEKLEKELERDRSVCVEKGIDFGYSRPRTDFDDCETMYYEAELSLLTGSPFSSNDNVVNVQNYIIKHYRRKISLKEISKALFLSDTYLCEIFKKYTGKTISTYITELRMKKASQLIIKSEFTLQEVAQKVGYSSYAYFGKVFKQYYGLPPEKFRLQQVSKLNA